MTKRAIVVLGALALGLAAQGCANPHPEPWNTPLPQDLHPITVRQTRSAVEIPVAGRADLSSADIAAIRNIGAEYLAVGHGPITIASPAGGGNRDAALAAAGRARDVLYDMGIAYGSMQETSYDAAGRVDAPIVVMVDRYVADGPTCHREWDDFARTYNGGNTINFGCASQANLAAVVTDPADLLGPREVTPADAARRSVVLGVYRTGETTVTERGDDEGARVSDAVD